MLLLMHNAASSARIVRFSTSDMAPLCARSAALRGPFLTTEFAAVPDNPLPTTNRMNGKADIAFLLNPKAQAQMLSCHTPEPRTQYIIATPPATPPPMSLFRSLSPVARFPERVALSLSPTRKMQASYESVHQKRFSNVRCYGDDNTRLPLLSLAAMYAASSSNSSRNASPASSVASSKLSEEERSSASSRPSNAGNPSR
ncbi:hypothetical protein PRNP1_004662 [Phytophthora ramorum]